MPITEEQLKKDVERIGRIPFLPALLDVVCIATGMGFAAVARVTEERWIAGAVKDDLEFGLVPGGELPIATTICHEIQQSKEPVIIDHVAHDAHYFNHHTPAMYGLQSYISFPIILKDGTFFGTLCAIDPHAAVINTPVMINLFTIFTTLIAEYLDGKQTLSPENIGKLERYAAAELASARRDMGPDVLPLFEEEQSQQKMALLTMRMKLLLIALNPKGAFMR